MRFLGMEEKTRLSARGSVHSYGIRNVVSTTSEDSRKEEQPLGEGEVSDHALYAISCRPR